LELEAQLVGNLSLICAIENFFHLSMVIMPFSHAGKIKVSAHHNLHLHLKVENGDGFFVLSVTL
jgi:hypothetical protein